MKKVKVWGIIISFILSVLLHSIYQLFPNVILSILVPVNESIWEHMKLIATASFIFGVIEYYILKKKYIRVNNFILSYAISVILGILLYLIIYIPLNDIFGHKIYIAIGLLFLIFIFIQIINYYMMNYKNIKYGKELGILLIIIIYVMFGYLTYNPPKINLFYDYMNNYFGTKKE